jgi:hypothetical protein
MVQPLTDPEMKIKSATTTPKRLGLEDEEVEVTII